MTNTQKIALIKATVKTYLSNRESEYHGRGFKRTHEMAAISKIRRQIAYVEKLDFDSHCAMVRTLSSDIIAIAPERNESTKNHQAWRDMRRVLAACQKQAPKMEQTKLFAR